MDARPTASDTPRSAVLADRALRTALTAFLRRRVPEEDVEDVVQATLTDALSAERAPVDPTEIKRWAFGIARNKAHDLHRGKQREVPRDFGEDELPAGSGPESARELLRWAERELPEGGERTLEWMLREGDGEKLEHIAREESVPGPRVRQRITRLRRHFRERRALQAAALLGAILLAFGGFELGKRLHSPEPHIAEEPPRKPTPEERARELRRLALEDCKSGKVAPCVDGLDRARSLDPAGDAAPEIQEARRVAGAVLAPAPAPSPEPSFRARPEERPASSALPPAPKPPLGKHGSSISPGAPTATPPAPKPFRAPKKPSAHVTSDGLSESN